MEKIKYFRDHPCGSYFLQGGVRSVAILDIVWFCFANYFAIILQMKYWSKFANFIGNIIICNDINWIRACEKVSRLGGDEKGWKFKNTLLW